MIKDTSPTIETQAGYLDGSALRFLNADLASQAIGVVQNKIDAAKNQGKALSLPMIMPCLRYIKAYAIVFGWRDMMMQR